MSTEQVYTSGAATSLVTTAETAVLTFTVAPEVQGPSGQGLTLDCSINFTPGAAATAVVLRVRQGVGVAGAVVGNPCTNPVTAAQANSFASAQVVDPQTNYPAGNTYTLTAQQVAATGNGTLANATADVAPCTSQVG
jgi:hypothetical protein